MVKPLQAQGTWPHPEHLKKYGYNSTASSIGSTDTNLILAGTRASTSNLGAYFWLSTLVPAQI